MTSINKDFYEFENKIFRIIVIVSIILSSICIIGNILGGFFWYVNIKWIAMIAVSFFTLWSMKEKIWMKQLRLIFFLFIILIMLPYGWISSGGSNNNTIAYIFIIIIGITFFFQNRTRCFLVFLIIIMFISLILIEYYFPHIIAIHNSKSQFIDRIIQIPITLITTYYLLKQFADEYNLEKEMNDKYSEELKKINRELEILATVDELSETYNRRTYNTKLEQILSSEILKDNDIYLILFDIDHFKTINDTYGHIVGDKIISYIGKISKDIIPKDSFISRWGGDEFTIIYSDKEKELVRTISNLQNEIRNINIVNTLTITISLGITKIKLGDSKEDLFKRVDEALYSAKQKGRDRYVIQ